MVSKDSIKEILFWIVEFWAKRSPREQLFLTVGLLFTVALMGYQFGLSPFLDRLTRLDRLIQQKEKEIVEITQLRDQYLLASQKVSAIESRLSTDKEGFSLFSYVEGIAVKERIRDRIIFIRPQPAQVSGNYREVAVEVKMEGVNLPQVVSFLQGIQSSPQYLRIKRAQFKTRYNDPKLLDGTFVLASYERVT